MTFSPFDVESYSLVCPSRVISKGNKKGEKERNKKYVAHYLRRNALKLKIATDKILEHSAASTLFASVAFQGV